MKQEEETLVSNNGWQNIGICNQLAIDLINFKYRSAYMFLVQISFGYCQSKTNRYTHKKIAKELGCSEKTFYNHIHWLEDNGFIEILSYSGYIVDGGSKPFAYAPKFPHKIDKKYGLINIKDANKDRDRKKSLQKAKDKLRDGTLL